MNFIIKLDVYSHDVMFSVGESDKEFKKSLGKHLPIDVFRELMNDEICITNPHRNGRTWHHLVEGQTIIRLPYKPKDAFDYGTVSHEIFHAIDYIFKRIGISLSESSDEAYAYAIGYVTTEFYKLLTL